MRALANRALGAAWKRHPAANDELDVGLIDLKILRKIDGRSSRVDNQINEVAIYYFAD